jgi:hypothetical protein
MQIAVFAGKGFVRFDFEFRLWCVSWVQVLSQNLIPRVKLDELDIVLLCHRVRHIAHRDLEAFIGAGYDRHVLLAGRVDRSFLEPQHRLVAADELSPARMHNLDHVSADFTPVDLVQFNWHRFLPLLSQSMRDRPLGLVGISQVLLNLPGIQPE